MGRRCCLILLLLFGSSVFCLAAPPAWVEVRSQHFTVVTDGNERQGTEVAQRFEQMRGIFVVMFNKQKLNLPVPLQIVAFQSADEFQHYVPLWKGKPVSLVGFYEGSEDRDFIGIDLSSRDPYGTVFHEYAHLLLHASFPVMPLWFEEGFAEYFANMQVNGKDVEYGGFTDQHVPLLKSNTWMPIASLFGVDRNSDVYNENDRRSMFYAESWLAVEYLLANDRLLDAFKYLQLTQIQHVSLPESVKQAFGVDAVTFEKNLHQFLAQPPQPKHMTLPELSDASFRVTKLSPFNSKAILADMHAHSESYAAVALTELQEILGSDPGNEIANRALGYLYLRKGEFDSAAAAFKRALAANDNDAQAHYLVAYLINRKAMKDGRPPENPIEMRRELERSIQLDPSLADAHNLLAYALAADKKFDMAIDEQKRAIELNPSAEMYQANLAHLYLQADRLDDAEAILNRLQVSSDPKIRDNATQNLAAVKANREVAKQQTQAKAMGYTDPTAPQWKMPADMKDDQPPTDQDSQIDNRKTLYMYAELVSVDCSHAPVAVLAVRKGPKTMKLRTEDYKKLLVMSGDPFSCDWRDRKVLVNYKPGGKSDGDLVTLELEAGK